MARKAHGILKQSLSKHPAAALAAYATLLAIHEDAQWRKALVKLITATPDLVTDVIPRVNAKAAGILSECRTQLVAEECEYATADMLPELFVAPPWVINKKTNVIPVFDLPVLPIPAVTDITPGITELISHTDISRFSEIAQYQSSQQTLFTDLPLIEKKAGRHLSFLLPEQQILWQLGFNEWLHCEDDLHEKIYTAKRC